MAETGVAIRLASIPTAPFSHFGGIAMPTTVLIDETGQVAATHSGAIFEGDIEEPIPVELLTG